MLLIKGSSGYQFHLSPLSCRQWRGETDQRGSHRVSRTAVCGPAVPDEAQRCSGKMHRGLPHPRGKANFKCTACCYESSQEAQQLFCELSICLVLLFSESFHVSTNLSRKKTQISGATYPTAHHCLALTQAGKAHSRFLTTGHSKRSAPQRMQWKLWMQQLLNFICRPGQCLTDINRRSAGIPFAFSAIMLAKPQGGSRVCLGCPSFCSPT